MPNSYKDQFNAAHQELLDAYSEHFISGDTLDLIKSALVDSYADQAREIAVRNGDMQEGDEDFFLDVQLEDLFDEVNDKEQFVKDIKVALKYGPKTEYTTELVEIIKEFREKN